MQNQPTSIFQGGELVLSPRKKSQAEIQRKIGEKTPNEIREKWVGKIQAGSELSKKFSREKFKELERLELENSWKKNSTQITNELARENQLGSHNSEISQSSGNATTKPGDGKYAQVKPFYPETQMWLRSYESNRKEKF